MALLSLSSSACRPMRWRNCRWRIKAQSVIKSTMASIAAM